jgi:hypothetical protein
VFVAGRSCRCITSIPIDLSHGIAVTAASNQHHVLRRRGPSGDLIAIKLAERFRDELSYRFVRPWPIYKREKGRGRIIFHMIHASGHPEAHTLMKRAYKYMPYVPESEEQFTLELAEHLPI